MKHMTLFILGVALAALVLVAAVVGSKKKRMIRVPGKGRVHLTSDRQRDHWRNHPDFRPPPQDEGG